MSKQFLLLVTHSFSVLIFAITIIKDVTLDESLKSYCVKSLIILTDMAKIWKGMSA